MAEQTKLEEIESLQAIYGSDFQLTSDDSFTINVKSVNSTSDSNQDILEMQIMLPVDYPLHSPPTFCIKCALLSDTEQRELAELLNNSFNIGEVVIYQWVELAREYLDNKIVEQEKQKCTTTVLKDSNRTQFELDPSPLEVVASKEKTKELPLSSSPELSLSNAPALFHGEPLTDRKSTFQAHLAEVHSLDEVRLAVSKLKENRKIEVATHNILAYRFLRDGVQIQDCDDDGENAAGSRLLHLLQITDSQNVLVVVSRWYGGIQLGPDRFKHINNVARTLLQTSGLIVTQQQEDSKQRKTKNKDKRK
ncbi:PREDICTED: protein IMPACT-like, partial [Amphimedon queenslandica]